jgi:hypothetical protein
MEKMYNASGSSGVRQSPRRRRAGVAKSTRNVMANKSEKFYRIVVGGIGIYEAVDRDCPKDDRRREDKPDGSWLPKKGLDYPGAISFWSQYGLKRYRESGLMDWHVSVVNGKIEVVVIKRPAEILFEDEYQIIVEPEAVTEIAKQDIKEFLLPEI